MKFEPRCSHAVVAAYMLHPFVMSIKTNQQMCETVYSVASRRARGTVQIHIGKLECLFARICLLINELAQAFKANVSWGSNVEHIKKASTLHPDSCEKFQIRAVM